MRIYGPVPSRRFGLSLGVDVLPHKTCPFDCIYCQLGETDCLSVEPKDFFEIDDIVADVEEALEDGPTPDVITFAGSGEPTLYRSLGLLIDRLHELADIPILLITNSTLLWRDDVAQAAYKADILAPSLDAGDAELFERINQPHPDIVFEKVIAGLEKVTHNHPGQVHLEVMLIDGINDDEQSLRDIADCLKRMRFDRLDINTPVRPPVPERGAVPCGQDVLDRALELFGPKAHAIGDFSKKGEPQKPRQREFNDLDKDIRGMLLRRPCTVEDIAGSLEVHRGDVIASIERLEAAGLVDSRSGDLGTYYHVPSANPTILK
jgi:wyosine [tRNA(Phe)-imidazoG37] synthetase (radical SAM superfamily)